MHFEIAIARIMENPMDLWRLGTRVVDEDGYKATVVYVGPVATAKNPEEAWLGDLIAICLVCMPLEIGRAHV